MARRTQRNVHGHIIAWLPALSWCGRCSGFHGVNVCLHGRVQLRRFIGFHRGWRFRLRTRGGLRFFPTRFLLGKLLVEFYLLGGLKFRHRLYALLLPSDFH